MEVEVKRTKNLLLIWEKVVETDITENQNKSE